jgi:hypothetical protein
VDASLGDSGRQRWLKCNKKVPSQRQESSSTVSRKAKTPIATSAKEMLVKLNDHYIYRIARTRFDGDFPKTSCQLHGRILYTRVQDEWIEHGDKNFSLDNPRASGSTLTLIQALPNIQSDKW